MKVEEAQQLLKDIGFKQVGKVDGDYGPATKEAIEDFQRGYGFVNLSVDGALGPKTVAALRRSHREGGACSAFFKFREFACKHCGEIKVHRALVQGLDKYRRVVGPVRIVSGYRCVTHNRVVGGKPNSQHLYGCAADISAKVHWSEVRELKLFSGIGYQRSTNLVRHVDVRHRSPQNTTKGTPARPTVWLYG